MTRDLLELDHRLGGAAHPRQQIGEALAQHHVARVEVDGAGELVGRFVEGAAGERRDGLLGVDAELFLGGHGGGP